MRDFSSTCCRHPPFMLEGALSVKEFGSTMPKLATVVRTYNFSPIHKCLEQDLNCHAKRRRNYYLDGSIDKEFFSTSMQKIKIK